MSEIWKTYTTVHKKTCSHLIEVSDQGNVKVDGKLVDFSKRSQKYYYQVHSLYVHRMVAELFIPNPENKPQVDHINTDGHDNRKENLRWVTQSENNRNELTIEHTRIAHKQIMKNKELRKRLSEYFTGMKLVSKKGERSIFIKPDQIDNYLKLGYHLGRN